MNVGKQEATLKKITGLHGNLIIAQCDRPALFYVNRDQLQMQYFSVPENTIGQIQCMLVKGL